MFHKRKCESISSAGESIYFSEAPDQDIFNLVYFKAKWNLGYKFYLVWIYE